MSIEKYRKGWLQMYSEERSPNLFLTRHFSLKVGGIYHGKKVAIDIQRFDEDVAVVVTECTGPNLNDFDRYTTKEFIPPAYGEAFPLDVCELLDRMAGVDPFTAAYQGYAQDLVSKMALGFLLIDDKIKRAVELQASQILQTGQLSLINKKGAVAYTLDFKPKATHFPTVSVSWSGATSTKLADLESLANVIRADGKIDSDQLIFGATALRHFIQDDEVKEALDNRRYEIGEVRPEFRDSGATFYGFIWVGTYKFEMWAYPETYKHPSTGTVTKYVGTDNVIMKSSKTRLDITSAKVPLPLGPDPRVASLLPGRMSSTDAGFDVTPNVYPTTNGKQIMGELESRPLLIPVHIDGFGCLDTTV